MHISEGSDIITCFKANNQNEPPNGEFVYFLPQQKLLLPTSVYCSLYQFVFAAYQTTLKLTYLKNSSFLSLWFRGWNG